MHDNHRRHNFVQIVTFFGAKANALSLATLLAAGLFTVCLLVGEGHGQTASNQAQLYFFTNAACGPCRQVEPELEKLYRAGFRVMKIDTHLHPDWTQRFQIQRTPTVVLVANQKIVARHSGYIDAPTIEDWFSSLPAKQPPRSNHPRSAAALGPALPSTYLKGTNVPSTTAEQRAMQATVRLKVDDEDGSSYATGTVVHYYDGDALVLTCGHVFRDSRGTGAISAEYGFDSAVRKVAEGELIYYDADARDVALVAIRTDEVIEPVEIAPVNLRIEKKDDIFTIGCDNGSRPTIRHSMIKNQAKYDGVEKYEIYGRPVNGRSGGGLFTKDGRLVGVCNAAVVDVDEGVYVALDTIHWQFKETNLTHLFQQKPPRNEFVDSVDRVKPRGSAHIQPKRDFAKVPVRQLSSDSRVTLSSNQIRQRGPDTNRATTDDMEIIVVMRNRNAGSAESFAINNPSSELINQLRSARQPGQLNESVQSRFAQLRRDMPNLQNASGKNYRTADVRAQSPK